MAFNMYIYVSMFCGVRLLFGLDHYSTMSLHYTMQLALFASIIDLGCPNNCRRHTN